MFIELNYANGTTGLFGLVAIRGFRPHNGETVVTYRDGGGYDRVSNSIDDIKERIRIATAQQPHYLTLRE